MYFIIGLGNPGLQYDSTRHNIGFEVIERLAYEHNISLNIKKHKAIMGQGVINGKKTILVKPQTYMNLSGESIRAILDFYKEDESSIVVVYDDISLDLGQLRIRERGSAGGHNGVKSIIAHLGTNEFTRIKVGVGEKLPGWDLANYVLARFTKEELPIVIKVVERAAKAAQTIIQNGTAAAMNEFNKKEPGV